MVRTRFAPSPTGYLHIGGVRTALFNWLFARKHGGKFLLRIDDTDVQRNVEGALQPILDGFRWLGIEWDEGPEVGGPHGPYFQSQKLERYARAVAALLEKGAAYRDYATTEELQAERKEAESQKRQFVYSRKWMAETPEKSAEFEAQGRKAAVRLKMPREGACRFHDHIRGDVSFDWSREQDHVIQRAEGTFLYHLANVVDDHDMKITHVIRAEEHLSNTPRQIFIIEALGYPLPEYAHLPFVAEPGSKNKLSKRKIAQYLKNPEFKKVFEHGQSIAERSGEKVFAETFNPVMVEFYRRTGYLPEALVNYLLLLGWSLDDKTEDFTREEMVRDFTLERVLKAPASLDCKKLLAFQERHMQALAPEDRARRCLPYLVSAKLVPAAAPDALIAKVLDVVVAAGERIKVAGDILDYAAFFQADDSFPYDEKDFQKRISGRVEARPLLEKFKVRLEAQTDLSIQALEKLLQGFAQEEGRGLSDLVHPLRVALTGKSMGFGIYETLSILGKPSCLARIERALKAG